MSISPILDAQDVAAVQRVYKAESFDFRLRPGSAAVDRGKTLANVTDGFGGAAPEPLGERARSESGEGGISMASDITRSASDVRRVLGALRRTVTGMLVACRPPPRRNARTGRQDGDSLRRRDSKHYVCDILLHFAG